MRKYGLVMLFVPALLGNRECAPPNPGTGCIELYAPVCGADHVTYSNSCFADAAGARIVYEGPCAVLPEVCFSDAECASNEFCEQFPSIADAGPQEPSEDAGVGLVPSDPSEPVPGRCRPRPTGCLSNADCSPAEECVFHAEPLPIFVDAGVAPGDAGPSEDGGPEDGGPEDGGPEDGGPSEPQDAGVRPTDEPAFGVCQPRTFNCLSDFDCAPSDECVFAYPIEGDGGIGGEPAEDAGIPIEGDGGIGPDADAGADDADIIEPVDAGIAPDGCVEPPPPVGICQPRQLHCQSNADCSAGQVCELYRRGCPEGVNCPGSDVGICVTPIDEVCLDDSRCCLDDGECGAGQICSFTYDDDPGAGRPFRGGICIDELFCPEIYAPVCGVDGITYSNECEARRAGLTAYRRGTCDAAMCAASEECPPNSVCVFGRCELLTLTVPDLCVTNADCPAFSPCVEGVCLSARGI